MVMRVGGALLAVSIVAAAGCTAAKDVRVAEDIAVSFEAPLREADERAFAERLPEERRRLRAWWGATYEGTIRIKVDDAARVSMALVPAWRGQHGLMLMPAQRVRDGMAASLHEMVHIYAPNANRFLAEGLAVHAHQALGGVKAFPNFGADLHALAADIAGDVPVVDAERIATPQPLGGGAVERATYAAAGSFVAFLIERYGMEPFRRLYAMTPLRPGQRDAGAPPRWGEVYGKPLEALEADWRRFLVDRSPR